MNYYTNGADLQCFHFACDVFWETTQKRTKKSWEICLSNVEQNETTTRTTPRPTKNHRENAGTLGWYPSCLSPPRSSLEGDIPFEGYHHFPHEKRIKKHSSCKEKKKISKFKQKNSRSSLPPLKYSRQFVFTKYPENPSSHQLFWGPRSCYTGSFTLPFLEGPVIPFPVLPSTLVI